MKKTFLFILLGLLICSTSYAQNLPLHSKWYDGQRMLDGDKTIRIYDFGAKIDANGKIYLTISYEHIDKNKDVRDIMFIIRVLTKNSDMKNQKYDYCLFKSTDCEICKPEYEKTIGIGNPNKYTDYEDPNNGPTWEIVGVPPDEIIGIQLNGIIVIYNNENRDSYALSGFPKNSKIRR